MRISERKPFFENFAPSGQNSLFGSLTQKPTPPWKYIENFQFVHQIHRKAWIKVRAKSFFRFFSPKSQEWLVNPFFVEILNYKFSKPYFILKKFRKNPGS
jgi:hypothetical protein